MIILLNRHDKKVLFGLDIGLIDVHLLASTRLAIDARLWTRDKRLMVVADRFNIAYSP